MIYPHIPCDQIIIALHDCIEPNNNRDFLYIVARKGIYSKMLDTFFDIKSLCAESFADYDNNKKYLDIFRSSGKE
jgi:hypothetical protein